MKKHRQAGLVAAVGCLLILLSGPLLSAVGDEGIHAAVYTFPVIGGAMAIGAGIVLLREALGQ